MDRVRAVLRDPPSFWSRGWRRGLKFVLAALAVLFVSNAVFVGGELGGSAAPLRRVFGWVWLLLPVAVLLLTSPSHRPRQEDCPEGSIGVH